MKKDYDFVMLMVMFITLITGMYFSQYNDNQRDIEFAKMGLQECVERGEGWATTHRVWKRECKDE